MLKTFFCRFSRTCVVARGRSTLLRILASCASYALLIGRAFLKCLAIRKIIHAHLDWTTFCTACKDYATPAAMHIRRLEANPLQDVPRLFVFFLLPASREGQLEQFTFLGASPECSQRKIVVMIEMPPHFRGPVE